jgi:hypothetical protein
MPSIKSRSVNDDFKTFKDQFPNAVAMLNGIIDTASASKIRGVDLETIFKMVASRDEKIKDDLDAAKYFVGVFLKLELTNEMVLQLEKDMPIIIKQAKEVFKLQKEDTTTTINRKSASKNKKGGQPARFLNIWIIFLLLIVQYLLTQIQITPANLANMQINVDIESDRIRHELAKNCPCSGVQTPCRNPPGPGENHTYCTENFMYLEIYNSLLRFIQDGLLTTAYDIQRLTVGPGFETRIHFLFQNVPMMTIIVAIIAIMNFGTAIYLANNRVRPAIHTQKSTPLREVVVEGFMPVTPRHQRSLPPPSPPRPPPPALGANVNVAEISDLPATRSLDTAARKIQRSMRRWYTKNKKKSASDSGGSRRRRCKRKHRTQTKRRCIRVGGK